MSSEEEQKLNQSNSDDRNPEQPYLAATMKMINEEKKEEAKELCRDMFDKIANYVNGELGVTCEEYDLLLRLNQITLAKYSDMAKLAGGLTDVSSKLNEKFVSLQQYCDQIDQIESSVSKLEQTAYRLDNYAKQLESKFKALERRN